METLLPLLASAGREPIAEDEARLEFLLADFLAAVVSARDLVPAAPFAADGAVGRVGLLALRAGVRDCDDVDWTSLHHPGSVIWPVVLGVGEQLAIDGPTLRSAVTSGYRTAATVADALGSSHRALWHVTATAGGMGAASAASVALGLSAADHVRALALAAANVGGLAIAARERLGAAAFNRVAAASLGVTSARASLAGAPALNDPVNAAGGVLEAMTTPGPHPTAIRDGVADATLRRYPASGFLQSAVAEAARLRQVASGELEAIRVRLPEGVVPLLDGSAGGPWWDGRLCVLRAWSAGSAFAATTACASDTEVARVHLEPAPLPPGGCQVTVLTDQGEYAGVECGAPGWGDPLLEEELHRKWSTLAGVSGDSLRSTARDVLERGLGGDELRGVWT